MHTRSVVIALIAVVFFAAGALFARHHGYHVMPIVRMIHGQH